MDVYRVSNGVSPNPGKPGSPDNFESNPELEPRIKKTGVFGFEFSLKKLFFPEFFGIFRNFSEFLGNFRKFSVLLKKYFGLGMYYVVRTSKISLLYIHCALRTSKDGFLKKLNPEPRTRPRREKVRGPRTRRGQDFPGFWKP